MVCLLVLDFEKILHVPLTASLQMPLSVVSSFALARLCIGAFSYLCTFCVDSLMPVLLAQLV